MTPALDKNSVTVFGFKLKVHIQNKNRMSIQVIG